MEDIRRSGNQEMRERNEVLFGVPLPNLNHETT
jgi:hypothetical protein